MVTDFSISDLAGAATILMAAAATAAAVYKAVTRSQKSETTVCDRVMSWRTFAICISIHTLFASAALAAAAAGPWPPAGWRTWVIGAAIAPAIAPVAYLAGLAACANWRAAEMREEIDDLKRQRVELLEQENARLRGELAALRNP